MQYQTDARFMKTTGKCMQTNRKLVSAAINLLTLEYRYTGTVSCTLPGYPFSITPIIINFHEITKAGF
jgi:hypothetical protein